MNKIYYRAILYRDGDFKIEEYTEPDAEKMVNKMYGFYDGKCGECIIAETKEDVIRVMKSKIINYIAEKCQEINKYGKQLEIINNYERESKSLQNPKGLS